LDFEDKKPKGFPGKANATAQQECVDEYTKLRENADENDVFSFADGVQLQHHSHPD
jgi:hypothetical protein